MQTNIQTELRKLEVRIANSV